MLVWHEQRYSGTLGLPLTDDDDVLVDGSDCLDKVVSEIMLVTFTLNWSPQVPTLSAKDPGCSCRQRCLRR